MSIALRRDSNLLKLRPKVHAYYDALFKDPAAPSAASNEWFLPAGMSWDEFMCLDVDQIYMNSLLDEIKENQQFMNTFKRPMNVLFKQCVETLELVSNKHESQLLRVRNSIKTISCLIQTVCERKLPNFNFDNTQILVGIEDALKVFGTLVSSLAVWLQSDDPFIIKEGLNLVVTVLTASESVNQNALNEYFLQEALFDSLIHIAQHGTVIAQRRWSVISISLLAQYNKYESRNVFLSKLRSLQHPQILRPLIALLSDALAECRKHYMKQVTGEKTNSGSWFQILNPFSTPGATAIDITTDAGMSHLLLLYELIANNNSFIDCLLSASTEHVPKTPIVDVQHLRLSDNLAPVVVFEAKSETLLEELLATLSYVLEPVDTTRLSGYVRLGLVILQCILDDRLLATLLCDIHVQVTLALSRQRQPLLPMIHGPRALVTMLLDVLTMFLRHNMRGAALDTDLYCLAVSSIHRLILHLTRTKVRVEYHWQHLWRALLDVVQHVQNYATRMKASSENQLNLTRLLLHCLNAAVCHGDTFLPDSDAYDTLYYEVVRFESIFQATIDRLGWHDRIESLLDPGQSTPTNSVQSVQSAAANLLSIGRHCSMAITLAAKAEGRNVEQYSVRRTMLAMKQSYKTLSLRINQKEIENVVQRVYSEQPTHMDAFRTLVKYVAFDLQRMIK